MQVEYKVVQVKSLENPNDIIELQNLRLALASKQLMALDATLEALIGSGRLPKGSTSDDFRTELKTELERRIAEIKWHLSNQTASAEDIEMVVELSRVV